MTCSLWKLTAVLALIGAPAPRAQAQPGGERQESIPPRTPEQRAGLEQRLRQRIGVMVKTRLGLDDSQYRQLVAVNQRYEEKRRMLVQQERDIRLGMREEMLSDTPDQQTVARLIERMFRLQRERLDLTEQEQRELSAFLTPVQRAKYLGVQEALRKRIEAFRARRFEGDGPRGRVPGSRGLKRLPGP